MNHDKEQFDAPLLDHEADGIRELDNNLPSWWVWLFNLCILFAVLYMLYYHVLGWGDLQATAYEKEMAIGNEIKNRAMGEFEATLGSQEPSSDEVVLARGQSIYVMNCAPCHRDDGGGLVGPNLTDDYWIHGPEFSDSLRIIWNGVPEKGMVSWKGLLKPDEIRAVASYIYTFRGATLVTPGKLPENQQPVDTGPSEFE
jgi:cytochrome c oxidase cbb3-type subunit III